MKITPRRRARELVLQGLYERQVGGADAATVARDLAASPGHLRADQPYFAELWKGVTEDYEMLLAALTPHLDRPATALSPIERGILVVGAWELKQRLEIPYKVIINEAVELGKAYGATDGHRYVNGVLDKVAGDLRRDEIAAARSDSALT